MTVMPWKRFPDFLMFQLTWLIRFGGRGRWVSVLVWLAAIAPAVASSVEMRVAIEDGVSRVTVGSSTRAVVRDGAYRPLGEIAAMNAFVAQPGKGQVTLDRWQSGQIWIEPTDGGYVFIGDRWYRGRTLVVPTAKGLTAVNYVDLEYYLYSVLGGEMNGNWPPEALKAQAVAARSYALYRRERTANGVFDVGDTPAWQVYDGIVDEAPGTQIAVQATTGQVLTHQGRIIEAVFHSSAGNCTENVEDVWTEARPYLRSVPDFDQTSPVAQWTKTFSRSDLSARITGVGNVVSLLPQKTSQCGRIMSMQVIGDAGKRVIDGETLRHDLGLRSTLFEVTSLNSAASGKDKVQTPNSFQITGRGFGHGLGLSQWGAYSLAQKGYNYQQILQHYYKGTALAKIDVK